MTSDAQRFDAGVRHGMKMAQRDRRAQESRTQNLRDAETLLLDIRNHPLPELSEIWADLTDEQIEDEVNRIAHLHEWLNLS